MSQLEFIEVEQGSPEWLALRKKKITATDMPIIMGISPWKTKLQLYKEKISEDNNTFVNDAMKRGTALEPIARDLFNLSAKEHMVAAVAVKGWAMASLDGISITLDSILEIKCPQSESVHAMAKAGKVPEYYLPQIQHQLYVTGAQTAYYYSFDGMDGETVVVARDDNYIDKMIVEGKKFYDCIINLSAPEAEEKDYLFRDDDAWTSTSQKWLDISDEIKHLQDKEEALRQHLIFLSDNTNSLGGGISLAKVTRKGAIDYTKIPQLVGIDLDPYRKAESSSWRILRK